MTDPSATGGDGGGARKLPALSDEHLAYLTSAAITPDIAAAAGVYTATTVDDLPATLKRWERALPGIVFPWWRSSAGPSGPVGDDDVLWQLRPDVPLQVTDKATGKTEHRKYLFPYKAESALNAHPLMRHGVHNVTAPLIIVEGTKQTLAAVSALAGSEFAVVGMAGCHGWSQNHALIEDFKAIPWRGREVFFCLDADVTTNRNVYDAATSLRDWLTLAHSAEVVRLIRLPGGGTSGLDDVLAQTLDPREAMGNLIEAARAAKLKTEKWPSKPPLKRSSEYFAEDGGLLTEKIGAALLAEHPCARAQDGTIAVYDEGRYRIDQDSIMPYAVEMLGDLYKSFHLPTIEHSVITKLRAERRVLGDRPITALLNVTNGMLDLTTDPPTLHPHDEKYLSTVQLAVTWDPDATCPTYDSWLPKVLKPTQIPELEETAAQMFDMMHTPSECMFLFGPSKSGKSTFLRVLEAVMGRDSTSGVTLHELADNRFASAELYGKRLNLAADLSARHIDDLSVWKRLTGDDLVSANRKHGNMFAFRNQALFAFAANEPPSVGESSRAYFNRMRAFEFPTSFEGAEDPSIETRMIADELPGILRRWIKAYQLWQKRGSKLPRDAESALKFETQTDRVRLWADEELQLVTEVPFRNGLIPVEAGLRLPPGFGLASGVLYEMFSTWARENGQVPLGRRKFVERLTSINGVVHVRLNPTATRALNLIKRKEDQQNSNSRSIEASEAVSNYSPMGVRDDVDDRELLDADIYPIEEKGIPASPASLASEDSGPLEPLPSDGPTPVMIDFTVATAPVYAAVAAEPMITLKALAATVEMSMGDLKSELEHLERGGAIASRRPKRGFDILAPITERQLDYQPTPTTPWVNRAGAGNDTASDRQLLKFEFDCVMCGQPDDELSEFFPVCADCREKAGE